MVFLILLLDICDGVSNTFSKCYETTTRLMSYCHPVEKINQVRKGYVSLIIVRAVFQMTGESNFVIVSLFGLA